MHTWVQNMETHRIAILNQALIVPAQANQKQHTRDVLEEINPLPPLGFLAADIDEPQDVAVGLEHCLGHANCSGTAVNNVVVLGDIV